MEEFYKKKIIRDFLSLFTESKWKELVILCLEYGIIHLKRNFSVASLSLDDLYNIVDDLKEEECKRIKKQMKKLEVDQSSSALTRQDSKSKKPSSGWRLGDEAIFENGQKAILKQKKNNTKAVNNILKGNSSKIVYTPPLYPHWWGEKGKDTSKCRLVNSKSEQKFTVESKIRKSSECKYLKPSVYQSHNGMQIQQLKMNNSHININSHKKKPKSVSHSSNFSNERKSSEMLTTSPNLFQNVESKIKTRVQTDKKIFNMLKKNKYEDSTYDRHTSATPGPSTHFHSPDMQTEFIEKNCNNVGDEEQEQSNCTNPISQSEFYEVGNNNLKNINSNIAHRYEEENSQVCARTERSANDSEMISNDMINQRENAEEEFRIKKSSQETNKRNAIATAIEEKEKNVVLNKCHYAIEFDKNLNPQVITEYPKGASGSRENGTSTSIRGQRFQGPRQGYQQSCTSLEDISSYAQKANANANANINNNQCDSIFNSQYGNENDDDTLIREQNIITDNRNNYKCIIPTAQRTNSLKSLEGIKLQSNSNSNSNMCYTPTHTPDSCLHTLSSPHFNKQYLKYEACVENLNDIKGNYPPQTVNDEEFIKPSSSFMSVNNNQKEDLNQSEQLSSYAPSERTKNLFQNENYADSFSKENQYENFSSKVDNYIKRITSNYSNK